MDFIIFVTNVDASMEKGYIRIHIMYLNIPYHNHRCTKKDLFLYTF